MTTTADADWNRPDVPALVEAAIAALAAAPDLRALADALDEHLALPRSPLALARRQVGALPPEERSEFDQQLDAGARLVRQAFVERWDILEAAGDRPAATDASSGPSTPTCER